MRGSDLTAKQGLRSRSISKDYSPMDTSPSKGSGKHSSLTSLAELLCLNLRGETVIEVSEDLRHIRDHLGDQGYEVEVLAKLTGLSRYQVFKLVEKYGRDRDKLMREAALLWASVAEHE